MDSVNYSEFMESMNSTSVVSPKKPMTYSQLLTAWAGGMFRAEHRVKKISGRWFVQDVENPSELVHGPVFTTKGAAMAWADKNLEAVFERLKEERTITAAK